MSGIYAAIGRGTPMDIAWWQMCIRAVIVFVFGIVLLRVAGKRAFGRQSAIDIVLTVLIGSNLSRALTGGAPFFATLAASAALVVLYWSSIHAAQRFHPVGFVMKGEHTILVRDGYADAAAMRRVGVSDLDLHEAIRTEGADELRDVRLATLERSGHVSVVKRKDRAYPGPATDETAP
ncbi:MAG: YetF domain-containing protein [Acetobacteraceae bacterium]